MGLWNAATKIGGEIEARRIQKNLAKEAEERAKQEDIERAKRHEENKRQGMI